MTNWQGSVPPIEVRRQPGLSETLPHERSPIRCQACGFVASDESARGDRHLTRWVECDQDDRKTDVVVVLCNRCADRLIDAHHRLYHPLVPNQQHPGTHVEPCLGCRWRDGLTCDSPLRLARGGPGLRLEQEPPSVAHYCGRDRNGRRTGGYLRMYKPVTGCPGFEERAP